MRTRRQFALIAMVLLIIAIAMGSLGATSRLEQAIVPEATWPAGTPQSGCEDSCQAFVSEVGPSLRTLVAEGNRLAELGQSRSRNILELTVRMDRFRSAATEFADVLARSTVPKELQLVTTEIESHIALAIKAIDDSVSAIRSFNWDALGIHVESFSTEVELLSLLVSELNEQ